MNAKRLFDLVLSIMMLPFLVPVGIVVAIAIKLTSAGPALYWSQRVGQHNELFAMPKFRTMKVDTPAVATHLLANAQAVLTPIGGLLRATSLDEIPQVWSVFSGHMSFVGPRPALFNQHDLVALRSERAVSTIKPGITGWAQVNGRDSLSIPDKVEFDAQYLGRQSLAFDMKILVLTLVRVIRKDDVRH